MFTLNIPSGYVLAIFFVVFDVLCLAVTDVLLTRFVCILYYRDINKGCPVLVRSLDIPGVVTYLVGKWFSFANLLTFFIKIVMLVFVFIINFKVESTDGFQYYIERRNCTYDFIPTKAEWDVQNRNRIVERRGEFTRLSCREFQGDSVTFYRSVFNLKDDTVLINETDVPNVQSGQYGVNDNSFICLSPRYARNSSVDPILKVKGCSRMDSPSCSTSMEYRRTIIANRNEDADGDFTIVAGTGRITYGSLLFNKSDIAKGFSQYVNPSLHCLQQCYGVSGACCRNRQDTNCRKIITPCLIVAEDNIRNETLFERWMLVNESGSTIELVRTHPGPIVEGVFNFSRNRANAALLDVQTSTNWWELAGTILTDSFVYRYVPQNYELKKAIRAAFIPLETILLGSLTILIVISGSIASWILFGGDERPMFNTINGLSSILREENIPSGLSLKQGKAALVGQSNKTKESPHLGPVP